MWDDIIYLLSLLSCIAFAHFHRKLDNIELKKWTGTSFGLLAAFAVSGSYIIHPLICTLVNCIIIKKLSWKICHLVSLAFTFSYLIFIFRLLGFFGLSDHPAHTNLIMMMLTLKLCGLAFEINTAHTTAEINTSHATVEDISGNSLAALKRVDTMDIVHYAFNYNGVLTGPYYRYRTYWDWLHRPFGKMIDHWKFTKEKFLEAIICCTIHLVTEFFFSTQYPTTEEFGTRSFAYKVFYIYPMLLALRMRLFTGMMLSECVCSMSGLGAYPICSDARPGNGPRNYKIVEELAKNPEYLTQDQLDYETVRNMQVWELESCYTVRTAMRVWNGCIQYWLATNVYRRFPIKCLRTLVTFSISSLWHGWAPGYFLALCQTVFYLPSEDLFDKYYRRMEEGSFERRWWRFMLWFGKGTCLSYLAVSFQLKSFWHCINYYNNIYWIGHIVGFFLYITALLIKPYYLPDETKDLKKKEL